MTIVADGDLSVLHPPVVVSASANTCMYIGVLMERRLTEALSFVCAVLGHISAGDVTALRESPVLPSARVSGADLSCNASS